MLSIIGFLAVLGPLVVVHELGHYFFARVFNVKAEVFSIGFGPKLWNKKIGETEWRVSAIPLGGFVKLLGEEVDATIAPEDQSRALQRQAPWKRFFIFFGGPLFNFLWAIVVFMVILLIGEPQMSSVVGRVVQGSYAQKVGFQSGDRVTAINGKPVKSFEELMEAINDNPAKPVNFDVTRDQNAITHVTATPVTQDGYSVYGEATHVGEIEGLIPSARATMIGVSNPQSAAGKAGLKSGDEIVKMNGTPFTSWELLERTYKNLAPGSAIQLLIKPKGSGKTEVSLTKPAQSAGSLGTDLGLFSSELFIEKTVPKSPAEAAGLQTGDRLVSIGNQEIQSFFELKDAVQRAGEKDGKVDVRWERAGKMISVILTPTATGTRDALLKKSVQYTIGVAPMVMWDEPVTFVERIYNPFVLVYKATERMAIFSWRNIVSIEKMLTGDVNVSSLGGPILIGKIAGESLSRGLIAFLTTMAILSVGLGVLNVLPVPVLDGGHLLLLGIEAIRKRPLTIRQMEIFQQVGLSLILLLMVVVIKNDLSRLPLFN